MLILGNFWGIGLLRFVIGIRKKFLFWRKEVLYGVRFKEYGGCSKMVIF